MSSQHRPHFLRWIIVCLCTMGWLLAGTLVVNMLLLRRAEQLTVLQQSASEVTKIPVVTTLPVGNLLTPQWFTQIRQYTSEVAFQLGGIADRLGKPLPPTQVVALDTALGNRVLIQWSAPLGQHYDGVEIERSSSEVMQSASAIAAEALPAAGYYFDTTVDNQTTYYYYLRAYRLSPEGGREYSSWSDIVSVIPTDTTPPEPPVVASVESLSAAEVDLNTNPKTVAGLLVTWQPSSSSDVVGYRIYRSAVAGGLGQLLDEVDVNISAARDIHVESGVTYYYTVTAVDAANNESATTVWAGSAGHNAPFISTATASADGN